LDHFKLSRFKWSKGKPKIRFQLFTLRRVAISLIVVFSPEEVSDELFLLKSFRLCRKRDLGSHLIMMECFSVEFVIFIA